MKDFPSTKEAFSPHKRISNSSKNEFSEFFLRLGIISALLDPDSESGSGYGSTNLIESGSNPNPKHCLLPFWWLTNLVCFFQDYLYLAR
jgi:hypothetical protein